MLAVLCGPRNRRAGTSLAAEPSAEGVARESEGRNRLPLLRPRLSGRPCNEIQVLSPVCGGPPVLAKAISSALTVNVPAIDPASRPSANSGGSGARLQTRACGILARQRSLISRRLTDVNVRASCKMFRRDLGRRRSPRLRALSRPRAAAPALASPARPSAGSSSKTRGCFSDLDVKRMA
jgi:hypothetical protein